MKKYFFPILMILFFLTPLFAQGDTDKVQLDVPWYGQTKNQPWGEDFLGTSKSIKLYTHGCTITSASMVIDYYGFNTNPRKLNKWLVKNGGFADGSNDTTGEYFGKVQIIWDVPAKKLKQIKGYKRFDYRNESANLDLIRSYLDRKIPVIAETRLKSGIYHFVVLTGYKGDIFYMNDPLNQDNKIFNDVYNTSDKHGKGPIRNIYGLRVYEPY